MASSSSSVPWTPAPGRHAVNIGPSLGKALKARKLKASPAATVTTKRSNLPERDFYSFRFNFKPPSIDTTKPASIEIQKSADNTKVLTEYPSAQSGEAHIFLGTEQSAREVDCVLIYDEDTGTYSLEKLDSFVNLHYDRKTIVSPRSSPIPTKAPPIQKTTKGKGKQRKVDELEELLGLDEDAEGEIDNSMEAVLPKPIARKEEEEEEEVIRPPKPPSPVPPKAQPPPPSKARPVKPIPKARVEAKAPVAQPQSSRQRPTSPLPPTAVQAPPISAPPRPKPRPAQKMEQVQSREPVQQAGSIPKKESVQKTESAQKKEPTQKKEPIQRKEPNQKEKKARPIPVLPPKPKPTAPTKSASYADDEVSNFGRPAKRPRPSTPQQPSLLPTPPAAVALSLPGGSSSFAPPPPPPGSHNSRSTGSSSRNVPAPVVPPAAPAPLSLPTSAPASPPMMGQYSDEEEDWDEVSTANPGSASLPSNSNVDNSAVAYELALEQDIFGDVFEEVDGDDEGQVTMQPYADVDGGEEEIDVNAFEQELNEHMEVEEVEEEDDDDIFGGLVDSELDVQGGTGQPISLNRLASGGAAGEMSEEEYSSSEDSEDD